MITRVAETLRAKTTLITTKSIRTTSMMAITLSQTSATLTSAITLINTAAAAAAAADNRYVQKIWNFESVLVVNFLWQQWQ